MTKYDRSLLQRQADELYAQADNLVMNTAIGTAIMVGAIGGAMGYIAAEFVGQSLEGTVLLGIIVGGLFGFAVGWSSGEQQVFKLRLEAQGILCRMMIEKNTADLLALAREQNRPAAGTVPVEAGTLQVYPHP
ncbi:hypothetical protein [Longimicrobium sp.]|jgi:hypothetical protein|uniref:hypothetical protein n=1 Tax=Longimicrobium sp. TaxID=2029185 RepID=UPI002F949F22